MEIEGSSFRFRAQQDRRKIPREADRRAGGPRKKKAATSRSGVLSVTVSTGVAESQPRLNVDEVIQQADKALYRAKQGGRNRVEITTAEPEGRRSRPSRPAP